MAGVAQQSRSRDLVPPLGVLAALASECNDRLAQGKAAIGQHVGTGVVAERETGQNAGRLEFAQAGREHVRRHSKVALQIAVALRPVEQPAKEAASSSSSAQIRETSDLLIPMSAPSALTRLSTLRTDVPVT